ncbi:MAG: cell division protein FtsZ [Treponema sp.]|nr:cell division protein FtsZ [Treponema sp.]
MTNMKIIQGNDSSEDDLNPVNPTVIKVIGCGGCGGNAINTMIDAGVQGVQFIAMNTDVQDLRKSKATVRLQLGQKSAKGLGAGGRPEVGEESARENENQIRELLNGSDMVFITAGMGGGTGTGAAPVVAKIAKEVGALTVAVVTTPFEFEAKRRMQNAETGVRNLREQVDSLIVIPNEQIYKALEDEDTMMDDAYKMINDILRQGVQGISDIITQTGIMNRDFQDVKTVMEGQGDAIMGIGEASGENRAINAADKAINNKLLENTHIDGAKNILVNITGGRGKVKMSEPREVINLISKRADPDVYVLWGQSVDDSLDDKIRVTVIATGFNSATSNSFNSNSEEQAKEETEIAQSDSNFMNEGEFERITASARHPEPSRQPAAHKTAAEKEGTKDDLFGSLFGGSVYEDNGNVLPSQPARIQPKPQADKPAPVQGGVKDAARSFAGRDDEDVPAALRGIDIMGLPKKMTFGKR